MRILLVMFFVFASSVVLMAAEPSPLAKSILFHASFDRSANADISKGDARIYTADSLERNASKPGLHGDAVEWLKDGGRKGGALRFKSPTKQLVYFKAGKNVPYDKANFQGTVSLWMRLSPQQDLPKGFVDPLQITDKKWNDASFFVDFDQAEERDFRFGVFSDYKFWNPTDKKFDDIPLGERPLVTVKSPPFSREKWTHVVFTWANFNSDSETQATLYLNGKVQGGISSKQQFTWKPEEAVIMLGINYVGWIDDLVICNRALSAEEIKLLTR